jgi:rRNA maturation endonuclease Nob1
MICDLIGIAVGAYEKKLWVCHACTAIFAGPKSLVPKKCPSCGAEKLEPAAVSALPLSPPAPPAST